MKFEVRELSFGIGWLFMAVAKGGFLIAGWCDGSKQKVALEPTPSARGARFFYIMLLWLRSTIMPHYVKKLGGKNYWRKSRSVRVFGTKTVTAIFLGAWDK